MEARGILSEQNDTTLRLSEVSITAIKQTSENASCAVTLLPRTAIEKMHISSPKNISLAVPNLYMPDYGSRVTSSIYVRGIGARIDQPVVGLSIDNVPILNKDNYDLDILDIEQIEVLRGPQSTLYGRNTMGGLISIRTLSPLSYKGTRILAEYGNGNSLKTGISHYRMASETFGIGANAYFYRTNGFFKNLYNGENCDKEKNARFSLKTAWLPSARLSIENTASATLVRQGGYAYQFAETSEINYNDTCFYRRTSVTDGLTVNWSNGKISLTSVTSYQFSDDNMTLDQDFLPLPYFTLTQKRKEHAVTEDLIAKSHETSRIKWIGGIFGFYKHSDISAPVAFKDYGIKQLIESHWNEMIPQYPIRWDSDNFLLDSRFTMPNYGIAAYGEATATSGEFSITAGIRLDYEEARLSYRSDCSTSYTIYHIQESSTEPYRKDPVEIHSTGELKRSFTQLLPKLSVSYELPGKGRLYATVSKGYKAGGFNTQMFSDVLQQELMGMMGIGKLYDINDVVGYKPEKSWNYEIGGKFYSKNGKISGEFATFFIDCSDQQLTVFPDGTTTGRIMANAGKTRSAGVEIAATFRPVSRLRLNAGYGYTNAKFVDFNNGKVDYSGKYIPYAPQNTIFASASYSFKTKSAFVPYITLSADMTGAGKIYWNEENNNSQRFYALLNAGIRFAGEKYNMDFWVKNLTDTQYSTFYFVSMEHEFFQQGKPVRFGATLRLNI